MTRENRFLGIEGGDAAMLDDDGCTATGGAWFLETRPQALFGASRWDCGAGALVAARRAVADAFQASSGIKKTVPL